MKKMNQTLAMRSDVFTLIIPRLEFDRKNKLKGKLKKLNYENSH